MIRLAVACLALSFATPAQADWQGFKWGMTEEQVEAARSDVEVRRLEEPRHKRMRPSKSTLGGKWTPYGQDYQLYFYFDPEGQLEFIDIEPVGVECSEMNELLAEQFGKHEEKVDSLGPAKRTVRSWRLKKTVELSTLVLYFPSNDKWICSAKLRNPVPWLSR